MFFPRNENHVESILWIEIFSDIETIELIRLYLSKGHKRP